MRPMDPDRPSTPPIATGTAGLGERTERRLSRLLGGQGAFILLLAVLLGIAGGYGSIVFRALIDLINRVAFPGGASLSALTAAPWYAVVIPPAIGGLIVGPLVYFFAHEAKGHGVPEVMDAVLRNGGRIRPRVALVKILASALSIGTGGSVGREGPIVQIGSSVGSSLGMLFGLRGDRLKELVAAGAAAGIASTFNAPIAGALFAVEVILGRGSARTFSPLVVSAVIGTVVARWHLGNHPAFLTGPYALVSPWELPLYIGLGVLAALVGVAFNKGLYALEDLWAKMPLPEYSRGVLGGALVGLMGLAFPQVLGVGYEHIEQILLWKPGTLALGTYGGAAMLLLVTAVKILATGTTIGSGGSGGVFAPSLFLGASLGGAYGTLVQRFMPPGLTAGPAAYAMVSMGAVVAAATHAPLTAMIIVFELTDRHAIILPLMLSCILATAMAMRLSRESIYTRKLVRRGTYFGTGREAELMVRTLVADLARPAGQTLAPDTPLGTVVTRVVEQHSAYQYVVDEAGVLRGVVSVDDVTSLIRDEQDLEPMVVAADIMRNPGGVVMPSDGLARSLDLFSRRQLDELPVVDGEGRLVGRLSRSDVIGLYHCELLRRDAVLKFMEGPGGTPVAEQLHLPPDYVRQEIAVAGALVGKSIRRLDLRARFGVSVYAVRDAAGRSRVPDPDRPLAEGEVLELFGTAQRVARVRELAELSDR